VRIFAFFGVLAAVLIMTGTATAHQQATGDGALSVKNANGRVIFVSTRGGVIGRFDDGQVTIKDPNPNDGTGPIVTGADTITLVGEKTTRYSGSNVRFRILGGAFTVAVNGEGVDVSAIGRGLVTLAGTRGADNSDARYSVNGGAAQPFPSFVFTFPLAASQSGPGG
jgi:hypothetical protein